MTTFPGELITEILSLLPIKPLLRFQCVSKPWFSQINNSDFIKLHLNHSRERTLIVQTYWPSNYYMVNFSNEGQFSEAAKIEQLQYQSASTEIVGCCNGLVCIRNLNCEIVICNPLIGKYKKLPSSKPPREASSDYYDYLAFGYDRVNDDYKVFKFEIPKTLVVNISLRREKCSPEVYSLREHSWRMVEDEWPFEKSSIFSNCLGWPFLNGNFHWLVPFLNGNFHWLVTQSNSKQVIVAFNLSTEKFQVLDEIPVNFGLFLNECVTFVVLRGWLCLTIDRDVWVMKEYGVANSWTLLYTMQLDPAPSTYLPLVFSHDGEEVLTGEKEITERDFHQLFWYDIKNKTCKIVEIQNMPNSFSKPCTCMGSLLLLDVDRDN
ncbi:F-box protein CPR1-like [Corylus avellana]|uniref:F-box protein CPR1-like n=1 Tax=Corylus avellana TaxID=13451 RepID=UPI00286CF7AE|nr:F-box protein CPR1-like [Corylus avellana]